VESVSSEHVHYLDGADRPLDVKCFCGLEALKTAASDCMPKACTDKKMLQNAYSMGNTLCKGVAGYTPMNF